MEQPKIAKKPVKLGYAISRVSSLRQAEVQHGSLEQQKHMIERWCERQTANSPYEYKIVKFVEEDISGRAASLHKRTGMQELEEAMDNRKIDFFVAEKVDRIARDQIYNLQLMRKANEYGVDAFEVESGRINFRDRGSRLGFNVKNFMAEEYSWDLEEKVTKKTREAKVNNGKDSSTLPVLGLDPHPTKVGMYVRNEEEINIVKDIIERFIETRCYKAVVEYCEKKRYKTKARWTKEKIDRFGNRIPPKLLGAKDFDTAMLKRLLQNPKYRGFSTFKDNWNQFPEKQDKTGKVIWRYPHGEIIDEETAQKVDEIIKVFVQRNPKQGRYNAFLLTGILEAEDGSKYYGEPAKSGNNVYYYNRKLKVRYICEDLDLPIIKRVRQYYEDTGLLGQIYNNTRNHSQVGIPFWMEEGAEFQKKAVNMEKVIFGFSQSLRDLALAGTGADKMAEAVQLLIDEKKRAEMELGIIKRRLETLQVNKVQFEKNIEGASLRLFLQRSMANFEKLPNLEKKRLVQAVVKKVIIKRGENGDNLILHVCLDPSRPHQREIVRIPVGQHQDGAYSVEYKSSGFDVDGGRHRIRTCDLCRVKAAL